MTFWDGFTFELGRAAGGIVVAIVLIGAFASFVIVAAIVQDQLRLWRARRKAKP